MVNSAKNLGVADLMTGMFLAFLFLGIALLVYHRLGRIVDKIINFTRVPEYDANLEVVFEEGLNVDGHGGVVGYHFEALQPVGVKNIGNERLPFTVRWFLDFVTEPPAVGMII